MSKLTIKVQNHCLNKWPFLQFCIRIHPYTNVNELKIKKILVYFRKFREIFLMKILFSFLCFSSLFDSMFWIIWQTVVRKKIVKIILTNNRCIKCFLILEIFRSTLFIKKRCIKEIRRNSSVNSMILQNLMSYKLLY